MQTHKLSLDQKVENLDQTWSCAICYQKLEMLVCHMKQQVLDVLNLFFHFYVQLKKKDTIF